MQDWEICMPLTLVWYGNRWIKITFAVLYANQERRPWQKNLKFMQALIKFSRYSSFRKAFQYGLNLFLFVPNIMFKSTITFQKKWFDLINSFTCNLEETPYIWTYHINLTTMEMDRINRISCTFLLNGGTLRRKHSDMKYMIRPSQVKHITRQKTYDITKSFSLMDINQLSWMISVNTWDINCMWSHLDQHTHNHLSI